MGKRQRIEDIEARLDNLELALGLLLEIATEHKKAIDELDEHVYDALGNDVERLFEVVDPWGKRPGSAGYLYKYQDELLPWEEVQEGLGISSSNLDAADIDAESTYTVGEFWAFIDGYDEGQKDCAPCEVADENRENLPELSIFDHLRLLLWG